ncbi:hypothetical protein GIB67_017569 [Kingdonia uniflora]|uniref:CBS domain-containing protein n=1 Tax=Kingdonia uniflora TaxID=39325 RepID=A0A7J7LMR4_9MAGN|nr:hypothetical protein GIB67_017569 [Kingdonia uniflora]
MESIVASNPRLCCCTSSSALIPHRFFISPPLLPRSKQLHLLSLTTKFPRAVAVAGTHPLASNSVPPKDGVVYTVGDFMTRKEFLQVVKPTTTVDEALEILVENRITGFPVIDDNWKLVGLVSDYDLLALDSISVVWSKLQQGILPEDAMNSLPDQQLLVTVRNFVAELREDRRIADQMLGKPTGGSLDELYGQRLFGWRVVWYGKCFIQTDISNTVNSSQTFNEIQKLLSKTNGKAISDVMTPAPLVVRETTNLEDAARLLLETKYRRLPVVDSGGKLVGIITRGNVVRAALQIKREIENME